MYSLTLIARYRLTLIPFIFFILPNIVVAENKINHINSLKLYTPKDIEVTLFSKDVPRAIHMAFDDQGILFVSQTKDGKLYLSIGSSCNACIEKHPWRAAITRFNLDGSGAEIFAKGLRNSVGIEFSPYSGDLWAVNNGRDMLGDDHPKEELNII